MQLKYWLKRRDILFGQISLIFRNKVLLVFSVLIIGFFAYSLSSGEEIRKAGLAVRVVWILFSVGFATALYLVLQIGLLLIMLVTRKHVGQLGEHTLEIKDEGLEESTNVNRSLHRWNPSFRVKEFGSYIWIYPTDGQYFLIPKRTGGHEGNLTGFIARLRSKISS